MWIKYLIGDDVFSGYIAWQQYSAWWNAAISWNGKVIVMKRGVRTLFFCFAAMTASNVSFADSPVTDPVRKVAIAHQAKGKALESRQIQPVAVIEELTLAEAESGLAGFMTQSADRSSRSRAAASEQGEGLGVYSMIIVGLGVAMLSFVRHVGRLR
jgi:hypothetical protein